MHTVALSVWSVVVVGDKSGAAFNLTACGPALGPKPVFLDVADQQQMAAEYAGFSMEMIGQAAALEAFRSQKPWLHVRYCTRLTHHLVL